MAVGDAYVFPGFLTPVLTQISFQSHRLIFSHASAEARGEKAPCSKTAEQKKKANKATKKKFKKNSSDAHQPAGTSQPDMVDFFFFFFFSFFLSFFPEASSSFIRQWLII